MKLNSLRTKILVIVLAFMFFTGTAFVLYSISTTANYKRLLLEGIEETVDFETEKVNKIIAQIERGAIFYSVAGRLCFDERSEPIGKRLVVEYMAGLPSAVGGGFWFEPYAFNKDKLRAGFYAFHDKELGKARLDDTFFMDEYDYHNKNWYREIIDVVERSNQVVWTRPYVDDSGSFSLMTTAGTGIFDENGKLVAITTADWEIDEVINTLNAIKPTKSSFMLLCVPDKDYVISSTSRNISAGDSIKNISWDIYAHSVKFGSDKFIRFGKEMDNGWLLSVHIPEKEIFEHVEKENTRFSILIALASGLMLFIAYFLIARFINAPIKQLTTDVAQIELGNLDTKINIFSQDEIGQLAKTFNKMTGDLKKSIEENFREREEKKRISTELIVATEIQASMLPNVFPPFPDRDEFDIYASMIPAMEVGGDFYDFFFIDKDNLVIVIADVSGKGIPAALFMVVAKTLIKNCSSCRNPKDVFTSVNKKLCENNEACVFVTSFLGLYNIPSKKFTFVNAGHNPPLLKKKGGSFEYLRTQPCIVLAWLKDAKYEEEEITLEDGDILYLYTDGVTEAMDEEKTLFGEERLLNVINRYKESPPQKLLHSIKREVDLFRGNAEQADDITMLALKIGEPEISEPEEVRELQVQARRENLDEVSEFINREIQACGYSPDVKNEIGIAVEEIFINIANYAYQDNGGKVDICVSVKDETTIKFEDSGKPYNPLEQPDPDLKKPLADREIGGLGVFMVKKLMDTVKYSRENGKNILTITKNRP